MWISRTIVAVGMVALIASVALTQQRPQPVAATPASTNQEKADYSQEPFVVEQFLSRARFEDDGTGVRELQVRIRVQSEAGVQQLGQLAFGYNAANERMEIDSVEVRKADGSATAASTSAVQDMTAPVARDAPVYTDTRQKHVTVPGLRPGDTLAYHITTRVHTPLAPGQFWMEYDFIKEAIVLDEQLEVDVPRQRAVKLKTQPGLDPAVTQSADRRIYRWKASNLKRESDGHAQPKQKAAKKSEGPALQLTTFQSWEEVGRWYAPLERQRAVPTASIRARAEELVRGRATDAERVEALYDFVAKNFRYVSLSFGVSRYEPHAAAEVLANQYGDCKDKHTLLAALAEAIGLRAFPALISTSRKMDADVPSPSQFDHVITVIPVGQEWFWMDSTTGVAPFRLLSANLRHKKALVIPIAMQTDDAARLVETPADPPFTSTQRVEVDGQVSELGKLTARVRYTLRGDNELDLRIVFRRAAQKQWQQLGQLLAAADGLSGEVTQVKVGDPAATREPFPVEYQIALANFLDWSKNKSQLPLPLPSVGLPEAPEADDAADADAEPVQLGSPLDVTTRVQLDLPAKYTLRAPVAVAIMRDYAEYRSSYTVEGHRITAERTLRFRMRELPARRAPDYRAFARAVRADEGQLLAVESTAADTPAIPASAQADELYESALAAFRNGNFPAAVELLERVVHMEPKHKRAWNDLGRAYAAQTRWAQAVEAFRKQLEVNPEDEQAHLLLGLAFWQQRNYEEAVAALRKQIELNPLDRQAHATLGLVYFESRKYAEAVSELEKAVILVPQNPALYVALGQAYLGLGNGQEALAAFDKAVELAPSPEVWNNLAYQLSLHNVHLERAQQYAESAVAAISAELRNAALDRLTANDLRRVSGLAASWDTLGWVHFQKGELDAAEKYIRAAWLLDQHGEVGDHLAQIYEKREQKQEAIRTYAQALAALRPVRETRGRLAKLAGGEDKIAELVSAAEAQLSAARTVKLGKLLPENVSAEFFVLLAPATGGDAKVEEVKFISGSEKLRPLAEKLRSANIPAAFPDDTPTKLVRRGVFSCTAAGECTFVLITPERVTAVN